MADRPDPFRGVKESSYSIDEYYTQATNEHDHSSSMRVPMPKGVVGQIQRWVQMGLVPAYRSPQDLVRDAVIHRLQWLADNHGDWELQDALSVQRGLALQSQVFARLEEREKLLANLKKIIHDCEATNSYGVLEAYLDRLEMDEYDLDDFGQSELARLAADGRERVERARRRAGV